MYTWVDRGVISRPTAEFGTFAGGGGVKAAVDSGVNPEKWSHFQLKTFAKSTMVPLASSLIFLMTPHASCHYISMNHGMEVGGKVMLWFPGDTESLFEMCSEEDRNGEVTSSNIRTKPFISCMNA